MTYDPSTLSRLTWRHGERARAIVAGTDELTNEDIRAWRGIGGKTFNGSALETARGLVRQGETIAEASALAGVTLQALRSSLDQRPL